MKLIKFHWVLETCHQWHCIMMQRCSQQMFRLTWWRHQMETFSALLVLCAGNSPVTCEFPSHKPVTRSFDVFFDLRLNKRLSKQSWGWWFETPSRSLWRHFNGCGIVWIICGYSCTTTKHCIQHWHPTVTFWVSVKYPEGGLRHRYHSNNIFKQSFQFASWFSYPTWNTTQNVFMEATSLVIVFTIRFISKLFNGKYVRTRRFTSCHKS